MKLYCSIFLLIFLTACQTTENKDVTVESHGAVVESQNKELADIVETLKKELADEQLLDRDIEEGLSHLVEDVPAIDNIEIPAVGYDNIWLKLAEGFVFEVPENARIAKQRDYYLKHPNYLKKVSKRAEPFLYLVVEQIEAKNLPLELVLLPIVESTFDPFAYSQCNASGLWQFMPATGKRFGLKQDWWYDGRRDVYASTEAALRYMNILHQYLGEDWLHALAAYNSGEGRVRNAVKRNKKRNKPTDYWHLSLPVETENYVPKLLALVDILRNHKKYGIELPVIPNKQVLTYVATDSQLDLAYAAQLADLSVAEIQLLNPAFNHWATPPDGPHALLIPTRIAAQFNERLSHIDKNKRVLWMRHKVRAGDSLSVIAQKYGTTSSVLKQVNTIRGTLINVGQALLIPVSSGAQEDSLYSQAQRFNRLQAENNIGNRKVQHTVVEGDTLWDISRLYQVTAKDIGKWNRISSKKMLRLGQKLTIWQVAKSSSKSKTTRRINYKVRSGDSLGRIALKFNVKTEDLVLWNQLVEKKYIHPGQNLKVYVDVLRSRT